MGISTPKGTSVKVGLLRKATVSQEWPWVPGRHHGYPGSGYG